MGETADAVAAHRCSAAVSVEEDHFQNRLRPNDDKAVCADAYALVADPGRELCISTRTLLTAGHSQLLCQLRFLHDDEVVATAVIF